jgi:deoxyribose-phosphate aldolase
MNIAALIDHTLLKPEATATDIERLCAEARQYGFAAVCVNPCRVAQAAQLLRGTAVKVCTVIGFPLGANVAAVKAAEARQATADGATELDMVLNIGALKSGDLPLVREDIAEVVEAGHRHGALVKVILETCLLTEAEKVAACRACVQAKADFVKTSTGLAAAGATVEDVALMSREVRAAGLGVKAAGGVRSLADLHRLVAAGATRIGTSAGVKLVQEAQGQPVAATGAGY